MKKMLIWMFAAILACGTTAVFTSCDDDDVNDFIESSTLIGTWNVSSVTSSPALPSDAVVDLASTITFKVGGSFVDDEGLTGKWSLKNKTLTIKYDDDMAAAWTFTLDSNYTPSRITMHSDLVFEGMNTKYNITVVLVKSNKK